MDAGTANNACLAGDWVPALVFGIPGDSITAIVIGILFMKGLRPGPMIFEQHPEIVYAVYLSFIVANLLLLPFGYLAIKASGFMLRVPRNILMPTILMFCVVGSFAINNRRRTASGCSGRVPHRCARSLSGWWSRRPVGL